MPLDYEVRPAWVLICAEVDQGDKLIQALSATPNPPKNSVPESSRGGQGYERLVSGVQTFLIGGSVKAA